MARILILGSGELGIQIEHWISNYSDHTVSGFLDDFEKSERVLGKFDEIENLKNSFDLLVIAIGYNHLIFKSNLYLRLKDKGYAFLTFIHPTAVVDFSANIGEGSIIYPGVILDQNVVLGENTLINNGVLVSHDSEVGANSFLAPGVILSGKCKIGRNCFIGSGTVIKDNISICDDVIIGAASLVTKSIQSKGTYYGHPIR